MLFKLMETATMKCTIYPILRLGFETVQDQQPSFLFFIDLGFMPHSWISVTDE